MRPMSDQKLKQKALVYIVWKGPEAQKVLLLKRSETEGSLWQPVTGGVEDGEDFSAGALREAIEETRFSFDRLPQYLGIEHRFEGRWGPAVERAFALYVTGDTPPAPTLDPREHVDFAWLSEKEAEEKIPEAFTHQKLALTRACNPAPHFFLSKLGVWFQEGEEITHGRTVKLLHESLRCKENGSYRVEIGDESVDVICEDVARFVRKIDAKTGMITLLDDSTQLMNPASCSVGAGNIFYCVLKSGEKAKFLSSAYYEIARSIVELSDNSGAKQYFLNFRNADYEIKME